MKIAYIANARIPTEKAHGIQIMKMCEALAAFSHEVTLVVPRRKSHLSDDPFAYYSMAQSFSIVYLPSLDLIRLSGYVPKVFAWLQNWSFAKSVEKYLQSHKPDLIYTRDELVASKVAEKYPVFLEVHNLSRTLRSKARYLNIYLRQIIVITRGLQAAMEKLGYERKKFVILPDGVDLKDFEDREELGLPKDKRIIMYTGHLYGWKGAEVLLEAAKIEDGPLKEGRPLNGQGLLFVFIGGTDYDLPTFKQKAKGLDNVLITGHKPHEQIPKYLAAADVLVLPNSGKNEISKIFTSPLKMFEYMASGKPIVASDLPSIREILNESNAILVPPDNPQALAEGISKALSDQELAANIAATAKTQVKNYTWQNRAKHILKRI